MVLYLMPLLNSFLHHRTSRQPRGLVELQSVQELLPNHLHGLSETLLEKHKDVLLAKTLKEYESNIASYYEG